MLDTKTIETEDLDSIAPYVPGLFKSVSPLLETVDKTLLSDKSEVTVHPEGPHPFLEVVIQPNESDIPGVYLYAARGRCSLGLFGGEYIEDNHPDSGPERLIAQVTSAMRTYLEGITVVHYYARNGKPVKWEGYWGTHPAMRTKAVTGGYAFSFLRKVVSREERSFKFITGSNEGIQRTHTGG